MPRVGSPLAAKIIALSLLTSAVLVSVPMAGAAHAQSPAARPDNAAPAKPKPQAKKKAAPAAESGQPAPGKIDAAEAQRQIEAAQKSLDGGKPDLAVNQANALMARSGLDAKVMARILAIRGQAYRKQSKPAQAISDLQAALELRGGLGESERATVTQYRSEAYKEAGLGEPKPVAAGRPGTASNVQTASTAKPQEAPTAPAAPSSGNFFSNLFGGGSSAQPQKPAPEKSAPEKPATVAAAPPPAPSVTPRAAAVTPVAPPSAAVPAAAKAAAAPTADAGRFRLQLGAVRSRPEAQTLAEKVKSAHAGELGERRYEIDEAVFGNMGTFYRVRIGPFADAESSKSACAALRAKGVDCMVISQ